MCESRKREMAPFFLREVGVTPVALKGSLRYPNFSINGIILLT